MARVCVTAFGTRARAALADFRVRSPAFFLARAVDELRFFEVLADVVEARDWVRLVARLVFFETLLFFWVARARVRLAPLLLFFDVVFCFLDEGVPDFVEVFFLLLVFMALLAVFPVRDRFFDCAIFSSFVMYASVFRPGNPGILSPQH